MPDYQQLVKVKEDAERRLRAIPGVHAVGIGKKSVGGKFTDELAIAVFLIEKKALDRLKPSEVIPPEIDGFKTDVVQMPRPRRLMAADPNNLVATVSDQLTVTFSGAKNPPGRGIVIVVDYSSTDDSSTTTHYVAHHTTHPLDTQEKIAEALAREIQGRSDNHVNADATDAAFTIEPQDDDHTCAITHCAVTAIDDKQYFEDHVRGGIQIQAGSAHSGFGTIGFLATTAVTPEDPQGKVVAITCQHVVCKQHDLTTNLVASVDDNQITFTTDPAGATPLDSIVRVQFDIESDDDPSLTENAFYTTVAGDMPIGIATSVASAITRANISGVNASAADGVVTVDLPDGMTLGCETHGPPRTDQNSALIATVVGGALTFTGEVDGDDYGIFVSVNAGGSAATCGAFTHPAQEDTLSSIATAVAKAISNLSSAVLGTITATPSANTVNFTNIESVACFVKSDIQVGQPDNSFGSPCSHCCSHRIGRVIDAKIDVDIAMIQLDAGQKWVPEIIGEGLVTGIHSLEPSDLGIAVFKRGRTLPVSTQGRIDHLQVSGDTGDDNYYERHYRNAIHITSVDANNGPFLLPGDSGSAIVDVTNAVVGIVFAGDDLEGIATPIDSITSDAFPDYQLNLAPAPEAGHAPGDVRTVPTPAMAMVADEQKLVSSPHLFIEKRLAQAEKEISATVEGAQYAELVKTHFAETQRLVNSNRRVATAWHRNGGPQIVNAMLRMLQRHDEPMPESIDGRPFTDCLERMRRAFARYASPALAADLPRFAECMKSFAGLTYPQMLATLRLRNGD